MREGWRKVTLGRVCLLHYGKALPASERRHGLVPVAGSSGRFAWHDDANTETGPSVVVGRKGTAGSVTWFETPTWVTDTAYWAEPLEGIDIRCLRLILEAADLPSHTAQTGVPGLNRDRAYAIPIALPPLDEQQRIVDLIAAVDDAIDAAEAEEAMSEQTAESLLAHHFAGQVRTRPLMQLADITDCEHRTAPATQDVPYAFSVGTPAVRAGEFRFDQAKPIDHATYEGWTQRRPPGVGDIVLTREAPAGEAAVVRADDPPIALGQRTVLISPREELTSEYLWLALLAPSTRRWIASHSIAQTVTRINVSRIKAIPVEVRSLAEQADIVAVCAPARTAAAKVAAEARALRSLRSNLLTVLLSGEHEIPSSYDRFLEEAA